MEVYEKAINNLAVRIANLEAQIAMLMAENEILKNESKKTGDVNEPTKEDS